MAIFSKILMVLLVVSIVFGFTESRTAQAATPPNLGSAASYAVFGKAGVTNTGALTHIWGNVGADLLTNLTGLDDATQVDGTIDTGVGVEAAILSAYGDLAAQAATGALDLAGTNTVTPGVYTVGATTLNGTLTLSGAGVYIFRSSSSISTSGPAKVSLTNGATPCNVFWQIPDAMTIGAGTQMIGTIITNTELISLASGASLEGRALSRIAQVTLDSNQITEPTCAALDATIIVTKTVINDNGGNQTVTDFPLFVGGTPVVSGVTNNFTVGTYAITETTNSNYTQTFSGDCDTNGNITLASDDQKTCTITNDDIAPSSSGGGSSSNSGSRRSVTVPTLTQTPGLLFPTPTPTALNPTVLGATTTLPTNLPRTGMDTSPLNFPWQLPAFAFVGLALTTTWIKRKQISLI